MTEWLTEHLLQLVVGGGVGGALMWWWRWRQERAATLRVEIEARQAADMAPLDLSSRVVEQAVQVADAMREITKTVQDARKAADESDRKYDELEAMVRDERRTMNAKLDEVTIELSRERGKNESLKITLAGVQTELDECKATRAEFMRRLGIEDDLATGGAA